MVGWEILAVLAERNFPISELIPVASKKSFGQTISYLGKTHTIISLDDLLAKEMDLALFSAGGEVSEKWAPQLVTKGCKVIDNSSFWRMHKNHKLIVPEINGDQLTKEDMIISMQKQIMDDEASAKTEEESEDLENTKTDSSANSENNLGKFGMQIQDRYEDI